MVGMAEEGMPAAMHPNKVFKDTLVADIMAEAMEDEALAVDLVVEDSSEISEVVEIQDSTKAVLAAPNDSKTTHSGTKTSKTSDNGRLPLLFAFAPDTWHALSVCLPEFTCTFSNFFFPYLSTAAYFRQKT